MSHSHPPADLKTAVVGLRTQVIGHHTALFGAIDSTNTFLLQRAREGAPEGLVALADEQVEGRGRRGRTWSSPPGSSVLCSVLLRPTWLHTRHAFRLTLLASVAIASAVERITGLSIGLKWPNDLQVGGRKLGGILVEIEARGETFIWAIIGCGINVNWDPTTIPELRDYATSIQRELGKPVHRGAIVRALLEELDHWYEALRQGRIDRLHGEWRRRLTTLGRPVQVEGSGFKFSGWAVDVDEEGALLVRDDYGVTHRLFSGEVSVRMPTDPNADR